MSSSMNTNMEKAPLLKQQCTWEGPTGASEGPSSPTKMRANFEHRSRLGSGEGNK